MRAKQWWGDNGGSSSSRCRCRCRSVGLSNSSSCPTPASLYLAGLASLAEENILVPQAAAVHLVVEAGVLDPGRGQSLVEGARSVTIATVRRIEERRREERRREEGRTTMEEKPVSVPVPVPVPVPKAASSGGSGAATTSVCFVVPYVKEGESEYNDLVQIIKTANDENQGC